MQVTLEESIFRSQFDDGLLDVFVGVGLLIIGLSWIFDMAVMGACVPAFMVPLWKPLREKLVGGRFGTAHFKSARKHQVQLKQVQMLVFGLLTFFMGLAIYHLAVNDRLAISSLREFVPVLPGILIGLGLALSIPLTACRRFAFYALLAIVCALELSFYYDLHPGYHIAATGIGVLIVAVYLLVRFLRKRDSGEDEANASH